MTAAELRRQAKALERITERKREKVRAEGQVARAEGRFRAAVEQAVTAGVPVVQAAKAAGVSRQTVHEWLKRPTQ